MNITDLGFTLEELNNHVENGYVGKVKHPEYPLWIYKYSFKAAMEKLWNNVTMNTRSLVLDEYGNIVSLPFAKFFNNRQEMNKDIEVDEIGTKIPLEERYIVTEKKDGSFIQMFMWNGHIIFTSSSTFESEHAQVAKELFFDRHVLNETNFYDSERSKLLLSWLTNHTVIFELIHPNYRIVVDYKDEQELYLIGIIDNSTGCWSDYNQMAFLADIFDWEITKRYDKTWDQMREEQMNAPYVNKEGYVVYFPDSNFRVKVKLNSYFEAHKLVSNLTDKNILINFCINDGKELYSMLPDEFYNYVEKKVKDFKALYSFIERSIFDIYEQNKHLDRKEYAIKAQSCQKEYMPLLMNLYLGRQYNIWEHILKNLDKYEMEEETNG